MSPMAETQCPEAYLYAWGRCDFGQLASGKDQNVAHPLPCNVVSDFNVVHASANLFNTACITGQSLSSQETHQHVCVMCSCTGQPSWVLNASVHHSMDCISA